MIGKIKKIIKSVIPVTYIRFKKREKQFLAQFIEEQSALADERTPGLLHDSFIKDMKKYHVSLIEWQIYNFKSLDSLEKDKYLTSYNACSQYRMYNRNDVREVFRNKEKFLAKYKNYLCRKYIIPPHESLYNGLCIEKYKNCLKHMLEDSSLIFKPMDGTWGKGIFKIERGEHTDIDALFDKIVSENLIVEECIEGIEDLQRYNPSSLNTIRLVTSFDGESVKPFYAYVRFGMQKDSVVDNGKHGGVWCNINLETGVVDSDAVDFKNRCFTKHPLTGYEFKGLQIPKWEECCAKVLAMHAGMELPFVGWDICVNNKGEVDIIEGNHGPDIETWQYPMMVGKKDDFFDVINGFRNWIVKSGKQRLYQHIRF